MIYRLMPSLITRGFVYIAESPLYEITAKNKSYFAYDEKEKARIIAKLSGVKFTLQRSKGLGENQPDMMWETTMNPETRRLIKILPSDAARTSDVFSLLLGDNLSGRKEYIAENGHKYIELTDVS
jgi:DNA gyrase subunit B